MLSRSANLRLLKITAASVCAAVIIAYAAWRSFSYLRGPEITITSPVNGSSIAASTTEIAGEALRVNKVTVNGRNISMDEQGRFSDEVMLFPGVNLITLKAEDRFGRNISETLRLFRP